jgi:molecular chaperone GrpE
MADDPTKADPTPETDASEERVRALEEELASTRNEARQNHEKWLRERADLENLKRRATRERDDLRKFANEQVLKDLLPVVDNLERAVQHARGGGNGEPVVEGVAMVLKTFVDVLQRHGLTRVPAEGEPFDPVHHEAMAQVESAEHPPNSVVAEHQAGYRLHDRLLRPALVTVSRPPAGPANLAKDKSGG